MADAPAEPTTEERWVYIGQRVDQSNKLSYFWLSLNEDGKPDEEKVHVFQKRIERQRSFQTPEPGAIFKVHTTKQGASVMIAGDQAPEYLEMLDDEKVRLAWTVSEQSSLRLHRANKRMRDEMSDDLMEKALRPILHAMRKTNPQGRQAIKLIVLEYLEKHGRGF